jgi:indolepyruvate ferredoxin oxidoreductase beta subunit
MNLIITGVGGQGNVLASRLLGAAALAADFRIALGETYGASQRGGAVISHLRLYRDGVRGPLIPRGQAQVVLGLEPLETLRVLVKYGNPATRVFMNRRPISPISCLSGQERYPEPEEMEQAVRKLCPDTKAVEATQPALELGHPALANLVLIGLMAASGVEPFSLSAIQEALKEVIRPDLLAANQAALAAGQSLAEGAA